MAQGLERTLIATVASPALLDQLLAGGVKAGDPFDAEVGGPVGDAAEPSAGAPIPVTGTVQAVVAGTTGRGPAPWPCVAPPEPFVGTVHLDALPYQHLKASDFYPYGAPAFDAG